MQMVIFATGGTKKEDPQIVPELKDGLGSFVIRAARRGAIRQPLVLPAAIHYPDYAANPRQAFVRFGMPSEGKFNESNEVKSWTHRAMQTCLDEAIELSQI